MSSLIEQIVTTVFDQYFRDAIEKLLSVVFDYYNDFYEKLN